MAGWSLVLGCSSTCLKFQFKYLGTDSHPNYFLSRTTNGNFTISSNLGWHPKNPKLQPFKRTKKKLLLFGTDASAGAGADAVSSICNCNLTLSVISDETSLGEESYASPIIDKNGRFCSPRAARELALLILYASCLEGSDPVRMLEKRLHAPKELYGFDKSSLLQYDFTSFGGPPIIANSMEEAEQLISLFEAESFVEAEVLSAPPKLVYGKLLLRFTKKLLTVVVDRWDNHVAVIDKVTPSNWKVEPAGRILEFSILHLAMSEISGVGTRHQIVINEAVDLAKRFCDGAAPRIINGCLRTYVQDLS